MARQGRRWPSSGRSASPVLQARLCTWYARTVRSEGVHLGSAHQSWRHESGDAPSVVSTDVDVATSLSGAAAAGAALDMRTQKHAVEGEASAAILSVADEVYADLIVVGNMGMARRVLSSVPRTVAQRAQFDVLIVHTT